MKYFKEVFTHEIEIGKINEVYRKVAEYYFYLGYQRLGIKIYETLNHTYSYQLSHYYHGSKLAGPYISSISSGFSSLSEALYKAKNDIFSFYDPNDEKAVWKENESF